jgi:hypothetical protein
LWAALTVAAFVAHAATAASIQVQLESEKEVVGIGESFDVAIRADAGQALLGFGFDLNFDESLFALSGIETGESFFAARKSGDTFFSAVAFPSPVMGDDLLLGTATFTALDPGLGTFSLQADSAHLTRGFAAREVGLFLDFDITPLDILVVDTAASGGGGGGGAPPTPEPTTLALLAAGVLTVFRRRPGAHAA